MRIRHFVSAQADSSGAFSEEHIENNSPELHDTVKQLDEGEIKKLLTGNQYVPLDLVALIYHTRPNAFTNAVRPYIEKILRSDTSFQRWLKHMELDPDDASSMVLTEMLKSDPNDRGMLNEVILDGSYARSYNYGRSADPGASTQLRNSLQPNQHGLTVPHCPTCQQAGVEKPLWSLEIENGQLETKKGLVNERCTTVEDVDYEKLDDTKFQELKEEGEFVEQGVGELYKIDTNRFVFTNGTSNFGIELTDRQVEALQQGLRFLHVSKGKPVFRCTFSGHIPTFAAFLRGNAIQQTMSEIWRKWKKQMGWDLDYERIERLKELEEKEKNEGLTGLERQELRRHQKYKEKKEKEFIPGITSLDAPTGGGEEGEGRTRHETEATPEDDEDVQAAESELINLLGEEDYTVLDSLAGSNELVDVVQALQNWYEHGNQMKEEYTQALTSAARYYIYGPQENNEARLCGTCGIEVGPEDRYCSYAVHLQKEVYDAYYRSSDVQSFRQYVFQRLSDRAKAHYEASNIEKVVNELLGGVEITEEDIFEGLDLSGFESYEEDEDETVEVTKLNRNDFQSRVESALSPQEKLAFYGHNIQDTSEQQHETEEEDPEKIQKIAEKIDQLIRRVEDEDLLRELMVLHRA